MPPPPFLPPLYPGGYYVEFTTGTFALQEEGFYAIEAKRLSPPPDAPPPMPPPPSAPPYEFPWYCNITFPPPNAPPPVIVNNTETCCLDANGTLTNGTNCVYQFDGSIVNHIEDCCIDVAGNLANGTDCIIVEEAATATNLTNATDSSSSSDGPSSTASSRGSSSSLLGSFGDLLRRQLQSFATATATARRQLDTAVNPDAYNGAGLRFYSGGHCYKFTFGEAVWQYVLASGSDEQCQSGWDDESALISLGTYTDTTGSPGVQNFANGSSTGCDSGNQRTVAIDLMASDTATSVTASLSEVSDCVYEITVTGPVANTWPRQPPPMIPSPSPSPPPPSPPPALPPSPPEPPAIPPLTWEDAPPLDNYTAWQMCNYTFLSSPPPPPPAVPPPPMPTGLAALSEGELQELEDKIVTRLRTELQYINDVEAGVIPQKVGYWGYTNRSGTYLPLNNISARFEPSLNAIEYRIYGACALAHREIKWSPWMMEELAVS